MTMFRIPGPDRPPGHWDSHKPRFRSPHKMATDASGALERSFRPLLTRFCACVLIVLFEAFCVALLAVFLGLRFALFALVASFLFLVVIVAPHLILHCRLRCFVAAFAEFVDRLDVHGSVGARCSPFAWLPQPEKGKCNNQQDDPKSIYQLLQASTSLRVRAFS